MRAGRLVCSSPLVKLLAIEIPAARVAPSETREFFELSSVLIGIGLPSQLLQIFPDELIDAGSQNLGSTADSADYLVIDSERDIHSTYHTCADRLLSIDLETCHIWGELTAAAARKAGRTISASDGLIAATARRHGLHVMTRNTADFE